MSKKVRIVIGVTASVAAIKLPELVDFIDSYCSRPECTLNFEVKIIITRSSLLFINEDILSRLRGHFLRSMNHIETNSHVDGDIPCSFLGEVFCPEKDGSFTATVPSRNFRLTGLYADNDELLLWRRDKKVLHILLKSWADMLLISPLDANTLAKIVSGIADNLLTCVVRAWQVRIKPLLVATAMNSDMYNHPITGEQLDKLTTTFFAHHIPPTAKILACGEFGIGAMASLEEIFKHVVIATADLKG
uniref:Flavoprotein domain-containing protein n=1 Tax=Paramoeba aestuarina TaxID=180227 RepID=A0A7S4KQ59_9EUKA|mmetsp:Transcript_23226/g.36200  ORF Transcript_23226/g.36200 Transcript_23226/m.36200 type:complete len:247 (+) Transcript_23226:34-774(+)